MILTTIDGIPLYSTIEEAVQWGQSRNLVGYHTHTYQGQIGYMGGYNHNNATTNSQTLSATRRLSTRRVVTRTSGSSGGGGGY